MRLQGNKPSSGFTLTEMLIAISTGLVVLLAAAGIYSTSLKASWTISQRAEMQQDARAAFDLMTQDISLAGAGLPNGGVALASGAIIPKIGCDVTTGLCHLGANNTAALTYPPQNGSPGINQLYGVIPGCQQGPQINAAIGKTDVITVAYSDNVLLLPNYTVQFNDTNGNSVTFTNPNPAKYQALNNTAVGLNKGDLILFEFGTTYAVADVTTPPGVGAGPAYNVAFANADLLQMNQNAATSNDLKQLVTACNPSGSNNPNKVACPIGVQPTAANANAVTATRIYVVSYYLDNTTGTPRLMRQVNALAPIPVADNVANLQFTYNAYDSNGNLLADATCNAGGAGNASLVREINANMTLRSQGGTNGYQGINMKSSISARNLSFTQRYGSN
jgi:Prokaryotic N-terminal methylation motif